MFYCIFDLFKLFLKHVLLEELKSGFKPIVPGLYAGNVSVLFMHLFGLLPTLEKFVSQFGTEPQLYHLLSLFDESSAVKTIVVLQSFLGDGELKDSFSENSS